MTTSSHSEHEYDILTVNNNGLIDLNSENHDLVSDVDLTGVEVEAVQRLLTSNFNDFNKARVRGLVSNSPSNSLVPTTTSTNKRVVGQQPSRAREIVRENKQLLDRLERIINSKPMGRAAAKEHDKHISHAMASSLARRQKEEDRIMQENLWLYNKLQAVQPSTAVARQAHKDDFDASRKYLSSLKKSPKQVYASTYSR